MRLDNLGQAIYEYILHILGVEEAVEVVALRLNAEPKGCGRLIIGLTHGDNVVVGGGHYGVGGILGWKPVNTGTIGADRVSAVSGFRVRGSREGSFTSA